MRPFATLSLLFALCSVNPIVGQFPIYKGPKKCPSDATVIGYQNLILLFEDVNAEAFKAYVLKQVMPNYLYILCPDTTYDLGEGLPDDVPDLGPPLYAFVNNTSIQCGQDGSIENNCVVSGGRAHVVMVPDFAVSNVIVKGITFIKNYGISVVATGHPNSDITFIDCLWKENKGQSISYAIWQPLEERRLGQVTTQEKMKHVKPFKHTEKALSAIDYILKVADMNNPEFLPESRNLQDEFIYDDIYDDDDDRIYVKQEFPSMTTVFEGCIITENELSLFGFYHVNSFSTTFANSIISNNVVNSSRLGTGVMIGIVDGGSLSLVSGTEINDNRDTFGPVFVDSFSRLYLNEDTSGSNNEGIYRCGGNAIFLETEGSLCLSQKKSFVPPCFGACCEFGDNSCANTTFK